MDNHQYVIVDVHNNTDYQPSPMVMYSVDDHFYHNQLHQMIVRSADLQNEFKFMNMN